MPTLNIEVARGGQAPHVTCCVVVGEGEDVRLAFLDGNGSTGTATLLSAVTLTRSQLSGFAGMVAAVLDADDPNAASVN